MAGYELIDRYLELLGRRLKRRPDRDDVLAEMSDHLRSSVEDLVAAGRSSSEAQRSTLHRFGEADVVADALACGGRRPAVPTHSTRSAGDAAMIAGLLWLAVPIAWLVSDRLDNDRDWGLAPMIPWVAGVLCLIGAVTITLILVLALRERLGGLGVPGRLGLVFVALAAPATVAVSWLVPLWGGLIAVGAGAVGVALIRNGVAPRAPAIAFALAWPVGMVAFAALRVLEVGSADEFGNYPVAVVSGLWLGCVTMAAGVAGLGRWLRNEEPMSPTPHGPMAAA
ncbi:MAG TPA: permease prefix domain 1-containing protein [Acidimicrobiales bacterium]|nr:permease prefix domain 1-containing protein [Acidimicrobiales bacterium]